MAPTTDEPAPTSTPTVVVVSNVAPESVISGLRGGADAAPPATDDTDIVHATDLNKDQWAKILRSSGILKAWRGQFESGTLHLNRAPCAAIRLRSPADGYQDELEGIPEFEVADDTYVETRESKTELEREMTLKAFTESGIHAALSGGAQGISLGLGGDVNWVKEQELSSSNQQSRSAIHGFYNFPRVIVHLDPDSFALSPQCEKFFARHGASCLMTDKRDEVLESFIDRFGSILACRVTLGGRLCTTQELNRNDRAHISQLRRELRTQLTATVTGAGVGADAGTTHKRETTNNEQRVQTDQSSRMVLETQGGDGLLASSIPDWTKTVASYRHWRTIQQDKTQDVLSVLAEIGAGTPSSAPIQALCEYSKLLQQKTLLYRPNFLDISATARYELSSATGVFRATFYIAVQISQPSLVQTLSNIDLHSTPSPGKGDKARA